MGNTPHNGQTAVCASSLCPSSISPFIDKTCAGTAVRQKKNYSRTVAFETSVDRLSPEEDRLREDYCYEALAFSRHTIDLEFDDETMRPEKATEAPRNAGIDPSAMKMKQWYQKHNRVSDQKAPTGTNKTSSWSWHQPMTWRHSSWQRWSSDETRECSDGKTSADWSSSDPTCERSEWRSSGSWQS